jgi:hypothetical protein
MLLLFPFRLAAADVTPAPIRLVSSTSKALVLAFTLPDGQAFVRPEVAGWVTNAQPGAPELPQTGVLVGLPPTGAPDLRILEVEQTRVSLARPVLPALAPVRVRAGEPVTGPANKFALDEAIYARDAFYPAKVVDLVEAGWLRDQRVARVTFDPFRYNPVRGELEVTRRLVVEIRFDGDHDVSAVKAVGAPSLAFEAVLQGALLNYDTARDWRVRPVELAPVAALNTPATQEGSYKITVDGDGLYRLTYADLQAAGLPVDDLDPRTFQLFGQGQEVAIRATGQGDGSFDPGDSLLFYGRVPRSRYAVHNVYWLRYGDATGLRMETRDVPISSQPTGTIWVTARYEEDLYYDPGLPAADGDHWYAADVRPDQDHAASLTLMPLATGVPTSTIRVRMVGYTVSGSYDPDHRAAFVLNGNEVGGLEWNGVQPVTATLVVDRSILQAGGNLVTVSAGVPFEGIWLDAVELDYPCRAVTGDEATFRGQEGARRYDLGGFAHSGISLYDVTEPQRPVLLPGATVTGSSSYTLSFADAPVRSATYLALTDAQIRQAVAIVADTPSNLRDDAAGADYLIVTHADLAGAVQPLVAYRQAQGLNVAVADVQDVYDEFSGGLLSSQAIRDFVVSIMPTYVLLVGDGSYDFLDHFGYGSANYIPPYLAMVDPWWGETAADNRYAAVSGDDPLPDVMLGRLPVNSADEAATAVQKILDYERAPSLGDWNARHVFVADDFDGVNDFGASADMAYDLAGEPGLGTKIYLDDLSVEAAREATLEAWNQGALLMSFVGHSSWHQWAVEALLDIHDVPELRNDRRWPVVLAVTCFTGFFHHPEYGTLDESLLRLDGGGAVATWSPSGLGLATGHDALHEGFYRAVFVDDPPKLELGSAILSAKLDLFGQAPMHADLLDTYHLFGDPAMALNLKIQPWSFSTYLPIVSKNH